MVLYLAPLFANFIFHWKWLLMGSLFLLVCNFIFSLEVVFGSFFSYEIHLSRDVQRKGFGKFLIQILELIGYR